ncbi:hypothetical protein [Clostridium estertheticum]|uniref:hypothetical protein n=1 Tax=Clostridium estertheticum TaxID=238834 RepID=UPI001C0C7EC1|nr:hypothetical protein [Clostridium estertheticum]MBU3174608.1 hypothetical protein [Clostridium estertheticum]
MDRQSIVDICQRVNNGEILEDICRSLGTNTSYMELMIKHEKIKKSKMLDLYYTKHKEKEIKEMEIQKKKINNIDTIEDLWLKRYRGIGDIYNMTLEDDDEWADEPRDNVEINLNYELLSELESTSAEEGLSLSLYIEKLLLQMLERNKETRMHTRGKHVYIKTMVGGSLCEDDAEEIEQNMKKPDFIKFKDLTYTNKVLDIKIYVANYLINHGYSLEQIEQLSADDGSSLYDDFYCSDLLEQHYSLIHSKECTTFEKVEATLKEYEIEQLSANDGSRLYLDDELCNELVDELYSPIHLKK